MKKVLKLAVIGVLLAETAGAAVDCNQSEWSLVTDRYVCLSSELKKMNNEVRQAEEKLSFRIREATQNLKALQEKSDGGENDAAVKAERNKRVAERLKTEADFWEQVRGRLRSKQQQIAKCRDQKCLNEGYGALKDILQSSRSVKECGRLEIPQECEIYLFSEKDTGTRSRSESISDNYYTFESRVKVNRPGKCVYLFLSSQYARVWNLLATKDTDLRQVFVGADDYQTVRGYPEKTAVKIGLKSDLAKNAEMCFNRYMTAEEAKEFLARHQIEAGRINVVYDGKIGDNAPLDQYAVSDLVTGERQTQGLRPREEGWQQLLAAGKARQLSAADIEQMKNDGVINLDNENFYFKSSDYKFLWQYAGQGLGGYVITENIDRLPAGAEHENVFLASGVIAPSDLKLEQTFKDMARKPDMFSHTYMMLPLKNVPQFADCNFPANMTEKVICADDELRQKNQDIKKTAMQVNGDDERRVADAYIAYAAYRLQGCGNRRCLLEVYDKAVQWFDKKQYSEKLKEKEPLRCRLKNIGDDCEVYAYSSYNGSKKENDLFISDQSLTYSADVKVNRPGKCVVLLLSAYHPVIWNIYTTPQTDLRAVLAGGHYEQMIRGMKAEVQTKNRHGNRMNDSNDRCLNYYYGNDEIAAAAEELNIGLKNVQVLSQPAVGEEAELSAYEYSPQIVDGEFLSLDVLPERAGLEQLIGEGKIRKVGKEDAAAIKASGYSFIDGVSPQEYRDPFRYGGMRVYLMLRQFAKMPAGLAGSDRVILMIPEDLKMPDNNGGHSDYYGVRGSADQWRTHKISGQK